MKSIFLSVALTITMAFTNLVGTSNNSTFITETSVNTMTATFDGAEGNYFFFTDENENAIQFEAIEDSVLKNYKLIEGEHIGEVFKIGYNEKKIVSLKL